MRASTALSRNDPRFCRSRRQGSIASSTAAPTAKVRRQKEPWKSRWRLEGLVPVRMDLVHRLDLLRRGGALVLRLPLLVGHAVDGLTALVLGQLHAAGVGGVLHPVR